MKISKETLSYNYISETRSFYISFSNYEVSRANVLLFNYPSGWRGSYEYYNDGQTGLFIFHVTSSENADPQNYVTGEINVSIAGENGFFKNFRLSASQSCSASTSVFLSPADDLLILNWWYQTPVIAYTSRGGATLSDVVFDQPNFTGWAEDEPGEITVYSVPDKDFTAQYRTGRIEMKNSSGTSDMIDYIQLNSVTSPIWRDIRAVCTTENDYITYRILAPGYLAPGTEAVYTGRAYRQPGDERVKIHINKILESFVGQSINPYSSENTLREYGECYFLEVDGKVIQSYTLYNDWSYLDYEEPAGTTIIDEGKDVMIEVNALESIYTTVYNNSGYDASKFNPFEMSADNINYVAIPGQSIEQILPHQACVKKLDLSILPGSVNYVRNGHKTYHINRCPDKAWYLLYKNNRGGYDIKHVTGKVIAKKDIKPYEMNHSFDNTTAQFERDKYMTEIYTTFTLNFPFQDKAEARDLRNLFESTEVYLKYSGSDRYTPVIVENSEYDPMQNMKVRNYKVTVKTSQSEIRR